MTQDTLGMPMRLLFGLIAALWAGLAAPAIAGVQDLSGAQPGVAPPSGPVVVELYTSQGCSSCPPADALLEQLARRTDVVAMALHVDYWDYIGWKDSFGQAKFTKRQKGYARAVGKRMIYTPQMVIAGQEHVVGNKPGDVERLIRTHQAEDSGIRITVSRRGDRVELSAKARVAAARPLWVQLVRLKDRDVVDIRRGENAGRRMTYTNIVTDWRRLESWDSAKPLSRSIQVRGDEAVVVIIQTPGYGPVLAAARAR